jgi:c-di-GMP phosphodiesterase
MTGIAHLSPSDVVSVRIMEHIEDFFIGRQPIYDRKQRVIAYELLYRTHINAQMADVSDGDVATSQVILNSALDIGFETLVGSKIAFINLTESFVIGSIPLPLEPSRVVLEVLEHIKPSPEIVEGLKRLTKQGYIIAMDDFIYHPEFKPLMPMVKIVKLDLMGIDEQELRRRIKELEPYNVKLLAEKVESHETFQLCLDLGFHLFQGFFFCRPKLVQGKRVPANRMVLLSLLEKLQNPDVEMKEIEQIIVNDPSLAYRLVGLVNSASCGLKNPVDSIHHAISILGIRAIRGWVSLIAMSRIDDKPPELMRTALVRARMCESIGKQHSEGAAEQFFTVGLFSVLDALLDCPMDSVLKDLPLSSVVYDALMEYGGGSLGETLQMVECYEQGAWDVVEEVSHELTDSQVREAYIDAIIWADLQMQSLG